MIAVVNHAGDLIWVKKEYKSLYDWGSINVGYI
jgi:hypothetical protein